MSCFYWNGKEIGGFNFIFCFPDFYYSSSVTTIDQNMLICTMNSLSVVELGFWIIANICNIQCTDHPIFGTPAVKDLPGYHNCLLPLKPFLFFYYIFHFKDFGNDSKKLHQNAVLLH